MNSKGFGAGFYYLFGLIGLAVSGAYIAGTFGLYKIPEIPYFETIFAVLLVLYGLHSIVNSNEMVLIR